MRSTVGAANSICSLLRVSRAHGFAPPRWQIMKPLTYALAMRRIRDTPHSVILTRSEPTLEKETKKCL
jgi:predicted deacetylase